jgi:hypothetical protein
LSVYPPRLVIADLELFTPELIVVLYARVIAWHLDKCSGCVANSEEKYVKMDG